MMWMFLSVTTQPKWRVGSGWGVWAETQTSIKGILFNLDPDKSLQFPAWWSETDYSVSISQHKGWNWLWKGAIIPWFSWGLHQPQHSHGKQQTLTWVGWRSCWFSPSCFPNFSRCPVSCWAFSSPGSCSPKCDQRPAMAMKPGPESFSPACFGSGVWSTLLSPSFSFLSLLIPLISCSLVKLGPQ